MNRNRKLITAIMLLVLLCGLLASSTYALISSNQLYNPGNIQVGTLGAELHWSNDFTSWHNAKNTAVFSGGLWEPGHTQVRYFKVVNTGNLEFTYKLSLLPDESLSALAEVIDVYLVRNPTGQLSDRDALISGTYLGTMNSLSEGILAEGAVLADGQDDPAYITGEHTFALILKMQEQADNRYSGMDSGTFTLKLDYIQFLHSDSLDVTIPVSLVEGATDALPESAIAGSTDVYFDTAPYAYYDTSLFAGMTITKIGIPVKSVEALDENQIFTLSVVKTNESSVQKAADTYSYVNQYALKLPLDQLGTSTTVNKWVYVDVDITLNTDETLAFGMPTDTVTWGYLKGYNSRYAFRSCDTDWTKDNINNSSILFDVITEETLRFKDDPTAGDLVGTYETPLFPDVKQVFPAAAISGGSDVSFVSPPYAYTNTILSGKTITKIGIPVKSVKELNENQTFTLSVVKTTSKTYKTVATHTLTLPLDQLGSSTTVNKWVYVDVTDLNITLGADETLAFGGKNDTVTWAWKSGYSDSKYYFRNVSQDWNNQSGGIFFDIYTKETLSYEDYQENVRKIQEQLEAEQEFKSHFIGKKVSVLGDSISTFAGYSNNTSYNSTIGNNAVWYTGSNGVTDVNETWWMQTINRTGTTLLVNNSWSGDTVTGRGISRSLQLHNNSGETPDIIAVYLGINDFRTKVTAETFAAKYDEMISGMKKKYPNADVYLFTLVYTTNVNSGVNPDDVISFNDAIEATAKKYGCTLVDLYNDSGINKDTMSSNMHDGKLHPNYAGMDKITECFMNALIEKYVASQEGGTQ